MTDNKMIVELLCKVNSRIIVGDNWLVCEKNEEGEIRYTVYQRKYRQKITRQLYYGKYLDSALYRLEHE